MKKELKKRLREYLKKYDMAPSRFADEIGIGRWSVCKFVKDDEADILSETYQKISNYLNLNP